MLAISSCVIVSEFDGQPVQAQQQRAAQLLLHRVVPVADGGLRHLRDQRLGVAQQQAHHRAGAAEFLLQQLRLQAVAVAGAAHHGAAGRGVAAHEHRDAHHALVADHGDFGGCAVLQHIQQGNDAGGREIHVLASARPTRTAPGPAAWRPARGAAPAARIRRPGKRRGGGSAWCSGIRPSAAIVRFAAELSCTPGRRAVAAQQKGAPAAPLIAEVDQRLAPP